MYRDYRGYYPHEYVGPHKCHLRALHNVHEAAAREAFQLRLWVKNPRDKPKKVQEIAKKYGEGQNKYGEGHGRVFHLRGQHYMALTRNATGSVGGFYYDDKVVVEVNDYNAALAVLEVMAPMTLGQ